MRRERSEGARGGGRGSGVGRRDAHAAGATETMDQATHVSVAGGSEADVVVVGSARVCDAVWPALV